MKNLNYWQGKNVFITGINGFIGGNLAKKLILQGANLFGLVRDQKQNSFLFFEGLSDKIVLIHGELTDKDLLSRIISEEQINVVIHLAAQVEIGIGLTNPYLTFETNIRGTYSLLESIRLFPDAIDAVIMASTDKSYGSYGKDKMPYQEDYPLIPKYPYDTSKACADLISQAYATEIYRLPIVVTRFCNIYGPGQLNFSALLPDAITSAQGYTKFNPRGDGSMVRDFIYVDDVADLYMTITENLAKSPEKYRGEIFNAGTNAPLSVREVIEKIYNQLDNKKELEIVIEAMKGKRTTGEIDCQYMDYDKVNKFFGWSPKHSFDEGLEKTIDWFDKFNKARFL
jgi:CDP-glucose 4,6-dehydratase